MNRKSLIPLILIFISHFAHADYYFGTLAGNRGSASAEDGSGVTARFRRPYGVVRDQTGSLYVTDSADHVIRKIFPDGRVITLAGSPGQTGFSDGLGSEARFNSPQGIAIDSKGFLVVADYNNNLVRRISPSGYVTTIAGAKGAGTGYVNGPAANAKFYRPWDLCVLADGSVVVADYYNRVLRRIRTDGIVDTIAGGGSLSTDGPALNVRFGSVSCITKEADDSILFYDVDGGSPGIKRLSPDGLVRMVVRQSSSANDGKLSDASVSSVSTITVKDDGEIWFTDGNQIRRITTNGYLLKVAGNSSYGSVNGNGPSATFYGPSGLCFQSDGSLVIADSNNGLLRKLVLPASVSYFAGAQSSYNSVDGTISGASFNTPQAMCTDKAGNTYVVDALNYVIRKISPEGVVSTFAGIKGSSGALDGTGLSAGFGSLEGITINSAGQLFVIDGQSIRKITPSGVVTTYAGSPTSSGTTDGAALTARFNYPSDITSDPSGNLYVAESYTIRKITSSGVVSTIAGAIYSNGAQDGTGSTVRFYSPNAILRGPDGLIYIADYQRIRRMTTGGTVSSWVGSTSSGNNDGQGLGAKFSTIRGMAFAPDGTLFVVDQGNDLIRTVSPAGVVTTIGGLSGSYISYGSDGPGGLARFASPWGIAVLPDGKLLISDSSDHTIRLGMLDQDADGVVDGEDAFPDAPEASTDTDSDDLADQVLPWFVSVLTEDLDDDNDGYPDADEIAAGSDHLVGASIPDDLDGDFIADAVDDDIDGDLVANTDDAFPRDAAASIDTDGDAMPDVLLPLVVTTLVEDTDDDDDGAPDTADAFPKDAAAAADTDGDGMPDDLVPAIVTTLVLDLDDDNDGTPDENDAFPMDAGGSVDTDGDGKPDELVSGAPTSLEEDLDDDGDGVPDASDAFPLDAAASVDSDGDGMPDQLIPGIPTTLVEDLDDDNDGYPDADEILGQSDPLAEDSTPPDQDGDSLADRVDADDDGDGIADVEDAHPLESAGLAGRYVAYLDAEPNLTSGMGGMLDLQITTKGNYTGILTMGLEKLRFRGNMELTGDSRQTLAAVVPRPGRASVELELELWGLLEGIVRSGIHSTELHGWRERFGKGLAEVGAYQGTYNLSVSGIAGLPEGDGWLQAKVDSKGTVRWTGSLPDGTGVSSTGLLGPEGTLESSLVLYRNNGYFRGSAVIGPDASVTGSGTWWKGADPKGRGNFPEGFGNPDDSGNVNIEGGLWTIPAAGELVLPTFVGAANAWISFVGGSIETSETDPSAMFELTTAHSVIFGQAGSASNPGSVKVTVSTQTGLFRGSVSLWDMSETGKGIRREASFSGVLPGAGNSDARGYLLLPELDESKASRTMSSTAVKLIPVVTGGD